jgi:hypothetical protein
MRCTEEGRELCFEWGGAVKSVFGVCFYCEVKWGVCKSGKVTSILNACRITNWTFGVYGYLEIVPTFSICMARSGPLCHACVLYRVLVNDVRVLNFACLSLWPGYVLKARPLCATYLSAHSFLFN